MVFIPLWIVMCVSVVLVLYLIILAIILARSSSLVAEHRRGNACVAAGYTATVGFVILFEVRASRSIVADERRV